MPKIKILPEQLANQIAAGEVVERPASVVKELLENSLDAGASLVEIEIDGGGTRTIRVVDNGEGMDQDDILLCLERHGTSKIVDHDDLHNIQSLGFRGEALPSIASVSRMSIKSRPAGTTLGSEVICNFGTIKKVEACGAPIGTTIEVNNLFGNTPARKKFLRTKRTELSHLEDVVRNYALARADIAFTLRLNGRPVIRVEAPMTHEERLSALLNYQGSYISLRQPQTQGPGLEVSGLIVPPEAAVSQAARLRLFVNGRAVRDRLLNHAVHEGLRSFILKGKNPAGVVFLTIDPPLVDINVHPAKHEIRFRDAQLVHRVLSECVREAMLREQQILRAEVFASHPDEPAMQTQEPPATIEPFSQDNPAGRDQKTAPAKPASLPFARNQSVAAAPAGDQPSAVPGTPPEAFEQAGTSPRLPADGSKPEVRVDQLLVIGTFKALYILCRNGDNLVLIDQHAAHERLLFEDLKNQHEGGQVACQSLLFPVTTELSTYQTEIIERHGDEIKKMGFSLRDFGGNTWIIAGIPALAGNHDPQELLLDVLDHFGSDKSQKRDAIIDDLIAGMACKAAVKSGDHLTSREIETLLARMARADLFSHCPHGRPVLKTFTSSEIKKWFHRT